MPKIFNKLGTLIHDSTVLHFTRAADGSLKFSYSVRTEIHVRYEPRDVTSHDTAEP